jgi:GTP cyclohydrolase I
MARLMPSVDTYSTSQEELVGRIGHALYEIDSHSGAAVVVDGYSVRIQIKCRTEDGTVIPHSAKVALMRYDESNQTFFVRQVIEALDGSPTPKLLI